MARSSERPSVKTGGQKTESSTDITMLTKVTNKKKYQYWALELNPLKFAKSEKLERIAPPKVTFNLFLTVF